MLNQKKLYGQKRVKALIRIKESKDKSRQDLANYLGINVRTLRRWLQKYQDDGIENYVLDIPRRSGSLTISDKIHEALTERVFDPHNSFTGYVEVKQWIKEHFDVEVNYHTCRKHLIQHFGTKLKSPRKSHVKKDDQKVALFKNAM